MKLCDVNIFVYAHRADSGPDHVLYQDWFNHWINNDPCIGLSEEVLAGFVRIVTNRKIFQVPTPPSEALQFCEVLRNRPNAQILRPGPRNWGIFSSLCEKTQAKANLVSDLKHAALAIEWGATWVTTDKDFKKIPDLHWIHPLGKF